MDEERLEELRRLVARAAISVRAWVVTVMRQVRRLAAPVLAAWSRFAIERWERVRSYLAAHPDLAEFDAWLDRWYSFGTG